MELGNHSEFLGAKSRSEMLAEFFIHDMAKTQQWRVKGHAKHAFWRWVGSWASIVKRPSDLGFDDNGFKLPPLIEDQLQIETDIQDAHDAGQLFPVDAVTLTDQRAMRKATTQKRVDAIASIVNGAEKDESALIWAEYNEEAKRMATAIPDAVEISGADSLDDKAERMLAFSRGDIRVLVTKAKIAGFGMNWQHCSKVYFMGASHSFESTYQAIRRCWRFGQSKPVTVRTCIADREREIVTNHRRKQEQAEEMAEAAALQFRIENREVMERWNQYKPQEKPLAPTWLQTY
jgi:superfamily II DNA or RNA helicase